MILVVVPYYNVDKQMFTSAVRSILRQSYTEFEVLVVTDGCKPTAKEVLGFSHPRLKFFDLKTNRGRYFIDAVCLKANPYDFYLPTDADDVSNFHRLYHLIRKQIRTNADMVYHYQKVVTRTGKTHSETYPLMQHQLGSEMRHLAHHSALYKTEALRSIGGHHPDYRVGYDTLLVNFMRMTSKVECMPRFLYTRFIRPDSLTVAKDTGFGSRHRKNVVTKLKILYRKGFRQPHNIGKIVQGSIKPETKRAVNREAKRLKKEMGW